MQIISQSQEMSRNYESVKRVIDIYIFTANQKNIKKLSAFKVHFPIGFQGRFSESQFF